jgi:Sec-independent protein translocase protein TatA
MFGPLGFQEVLFLLLLALLLFGPRQLPEMGRKLGRGLAQLRRTSQELKRILDRELLEEEEQRPLPIRPNPIAVPRVPEPASPARPALEASSEGKPSSESQPPAPCP